MPRHARHPGLFLFQYRITPEMSGKGGKMPKAKTTQPYIDYKTAGIFARMHDFIINANQERKAICEELDRMITWLQIAQDNLSPVEDPNNQYAHFDYDHFTHNIARLRNDAWEAGLTSTLFEKLKDVEFRRRFTGWGRMDEPVLEEEIKDRYEEE